MILTMTETLIAAPQLLPFASGQMCPACGMRGGLKTAWRKLFVQTPDPWFDQSYCPGGKEPTSTSELPSLMGLQKVEHEHPCAGIAEAHLHIRCRNCGWQALMELAVKP